MADETAGTELVASTTELSVAELREWLRKWVADATGQPIEKITVDRPMEEFGLASRDAIALAGDIEDLTGVMLTATIVYQHPTIASLAQRIIEGEPEVPDEDTDDSVYTAGCGPRRTSTRACTTSPSSAWPPGCRARATPPSPPGNS